MCAYCIQNKIVNLIFVAFSSFDNIYFQFWLETMHFKKSLHFCSQMYKMTAHLLFITYHFNKQSIYVYISSSSSAGTIAGGVIGGIFGLVAFCTFVAFVCGKICKKQNRSQVMVRPQQPAVYTSSSMSFKKKNLRLKVSF